MIIKDVIARSAGAYGITPAKLFSRERSCNVARARQIAMYLIFMNGGMTGIKIGELFRRSPGTVTHAIRLVGGLIAISSEFREKVRLIRYGREFGLSLIEELEEAVERREIAWLQMKEVA